MRRNTDTAGWVVDNVLVVLGLERDRSKKVLEDADGILLFQPLQSVRPGGWMSSLEVFRVLFRRVAREPLQVRNIFQRSSGLQFEPMQRILCKDGTELILHSFRPQRPRASTSQGIRTGVVECEVVLPR